MSKSSKIGNLHFKNSFHQISNMNEGGVGGSSLSDNGDKRLSILIFGDIGMWYGLNKDEVYHWLKGSNDVTNIDLYICSQGGGVTDAFVIHDLLKSHTATVTAYITGEACSAATIISSAANKVVISKQAMFMIHCGQWAAYGSADEMQKNIDILRKYDSIIADIYVERTGQSKERVMELMKATTYFNAQEALEMGFVDEIVDAIDIDFSNEGHYSGDSYDAMYGYWKSDFSPENTKNNLENKGYKRITNKAISNFKEVARTQNSNTMSILNSFLNLFRSNDYKVTDKEGKEVSFDEVEKQLTAKDGNINDVFNKVIDSQFNKKVKAFKQEIPTKESLKDLVNETVKVALLAKKESDENLVTAKLEKHNTDFIAFKSEYDLMLQSLKTGHKKAIENLSKSNLEAIEATKKELTDVHVKTLKEAKEASEKAINALKLEIANLKLGKAGGDTTENGKGFGNNNEVDVKDYDTIVTDRVLRNQVKAKKMTKELAISLSSIQSVKK